jgi:hypothetical protein
MSAPATQAHGGDTGADHRGVNELVRFAFPAVVGLAATIALSFALLSTDARLATTPPDGVEAMPYAEGTLTAVSAERLVLRRNDGRTVTLKVEEPNELGFDLAHLRLHAEQKVRTRISFERGVARWVADAPPR